MGQKNPTKISFKLFSYKSTLQLKKDIVAAEKLFFLSIFLETVEWKVSSPPQGVREEIISFLACKLNYSMKL